MSDDLDSLASDLAGASKKVQSHADKAIRKCGADLVRIAQQRAPVDTGALRASIGMGIIGVAKVEVGPTVHYAPYQEYGTYRMRAQPYMHPAADEVTPSCELALAKLGLELLVTWG